MMVWQISLIKNDMIIPYLFKIGVKKVKDADGLKRRYVVWFEYDEMIKNLPFELHYSDGWNRTLIGARIYTTPWYL